MHMTADTAYMSQVLLLQCSCSQQNWKSQKCSVLCQSLQNFLTSMLRYRRCFHLWQVLCFCMFKIVFLKCLFLRQSALQHQRLKETKQTDKGQWINKA